MKKKNKNNNFSIQASNLSLISKITVIILVIAMIVSSLNLGAIVNALEPKGSDTVINLDEERDLSLLNNILEVEDLRTEYTKTYLKENGMYEMEMYDEAIHYLENGIYKDIDNTLKLNNDYYINNANKFNVSFPKTLTKDNFITLDYNNYNLSIQYNDLISTNALLKESINRGQLNLKDSLAYKINDLVTLEYIVKQNSIKKNIILNNYIENYSFSFIINTELRVERILDVLYFIDGKEVIYKMNPYYMLDSNNNLSYDIEFELAVLDKENYQVIVTPSNNYLRNANYPVIIDPEISLSEGGLVDGIFTVTVVDKLASNPEFKYMGEFTINNRVNSNTNDDIKAYLHVTIPNSYNISVANALANNQFMYAHITLPTLQTNATTDSYTNLRIVNSMSTPTITNSTTFNTSLVDRQLFHNSYVFNHKYDIRDVISSKIAALQQGDVSLTFELSVNGTDNTYVKYSLGADLSGLKPKVVLGYMDEAGLSDYYTYENASVGINSNVYVAHNSGNLTYIYNDYKDTLLNLSHVYNTNRIKNNSIYGNGFNINYNEKLNLSSNVRPILVEGSGREVTYFPVGSSSTNFIAGDGSGAKLFKKYSGVTLTGYEIETSGGCIKEYNTSGNITAIYFDESERNNGIWENDARKVSIEYTSGRISKVIDNYGNYITFTYSTSCNTNPLTNQVGVAYLSYIQVYKCDANKIAKYVKDIVFRYNKGNLIKFDDFIDHPTTWINRITNISYNNDNKAYLFLEDGDGLYTSYDSLNRVTYLEVVGSSFSNGNYLSFQFDKNGKKLQITNGLEQTTKYTFDTYYHTNSIETDTGYTTFYRYKDIFYNENGTVITSPNYELNHKITVQSNSFKNTVNLITNHGFEVYNGNDNVIYGWTKELYGGSTASIIAMAPLYGSKVLQITATSSGNGYVYQNVKVEKDKEYIVTGYIKNNSTTYSGAYIDIISNSCGSLTNITKSNAIKGSQDFSYFEYKFTPTATGLATIKLTNTSSAPAYFDQISINTNYTDTRYNYLENSSFENNLTAWTCVYADIVERDSQYFGSNTGATSARIKNNGYMTQTLTLSGNKDDTFVFGGYCYYENYKGDVTVSLKINYTNGGSKTVNFKFNPNNLNAEYMMEKIKADNNYSSIVLSISNLSNSTYAYIDNFALYKEGYGLNVSYNNDGTISNQYDEVTDSTTSYTYDSNKNVKTITTDNELIALDYTQRKYLRSLKTKNITMQLAPDDNGNITGTKVETTDSSIKYGYSSTTYTADGIYPKTVKDVFGNTTTYTYDYITGLVKTILESNGVQTDYTYDADGNTLSVTTGKTGNKRTVSYTYDTKGRIKTVITDGLTYSFTYNVYGDIKTISVNDQTLLTNTYENENASNNVYTGTLKQTQYSYGSVSFDYDENRQIKVVYFNNTKVLSYKYNDYDEIAECTDYKENVTYHYNYDYQNRLINVNATNGNNITYSYDADSNLVSKANINGTNSYTYTDVNSDSEVTDKKITNENISGLFTIGYSYSSDSYKNLKTISYYINTSPILCDYTYETKVVEGETYYTGRVSQIEYKKNNATLIKYVYTYDNNSNIKTIKYYEGNTLISTETNIYDEFNQLITNDVYGSNVDYTNNYTYDTRGNITSFKYTDYMNSSNNKNYTYVYKTTGYKDELASVTMNGVIYTMSYSSLGNPSSYLGYNLSYNMDMLTGVYGNNLSAVYSYNAKGIRTSKSHDFGGLDTYSNYVLDGSLIIKETRKGNIIIEYYYDSNNNIIGFKYNNQKYMYLKNLQNDIVGIVDANNNIVVKYCYDGYGNLLKMTDTSGINLGNINPFRYRSYYFDIETGWYYLNSRYYNPQLGRFITMDAIEYLGESETILSYNLFSYCENNPINNIDPEGTWKVSIFGFNIASFENGIFDMSTGAIGAIIDTILLLPGINTIGGGAAGTFAGVKNIGKGISKMPKIVQKISLKIASESVKLLVKIALYILSFIIKTTISITVNFVIGTIGDFIFGALWSFTSVGNLIAAVFDLLDGKPDKRFKMGFN